MLVQPIRRPPYRRERITVTPADTSPSREHWERVYNVLVEECGAWPRDSDHYVWEQFISYMNQRERWFEFRFMGDLGFGGKFHRDEQGFSGPHYSVSCYPEDSTPERQAAIDRANERLTLLLDERKVPA